MRNKQSILIAVLSLNICLSAFAYMQTNSKAALADAAEKRDRTAVLRMLEDQVDVDATQIDGMTALHWAVYHDDVEMVNALLNAKAKVEVANRYGVTPLHLACTTANANVAQRLIDSGADAKRALPGGETPLMTASRTGNPAIVKALLKQGAEVNAVERKGQTALMWAASEGHLDVVDTLIMAGAEVDCRLKSGFSPLFFAVRAGHIRVAELLIQKGADIQQALHPEGGSKPARKGTSPLLLAVENGHFELALKLVELGADPNDVRSGFGPLHALSWVRKPNRGDGDDGDPPPQGSGRVDSLQFVREMKQRGSDIQLQLPRGDSGRGKVTRKGATPFMMAAITADLPLMKVLVELGADPLKPNAEGTTPLMAIAGLGCTAPGEEAGTESEVLECLNYMIALGADLNTVDSRGETAMHGAAYKNLPKVVDFLDKHGAKIEVWNRRNEIGWTPLSIASGTRVGNFKPSPETMAALNAVYLQRGVSPAKSSAESLDIYQTTKANSSTATPGSNVDNDLADQLKRILAKQQDSWNAGDIPKFMDAYWRDERLSFSSGGKVERGWTQVRDRYLKRYPDKKTMGTLEFSDLEVQVLSTDSALMLGRWKLTRDNPIAGAFSLVWKKIDKQWVIIHDHTSVDAP